MTAAELIDLLRAHPKTCERIGGIIISGTPGSGMPCFIYVAGNQIVYTEHSATRSVTIDCVTCWLLGACVEWCDEHGIEALHNVTQRGTTDYVIYRDLVADDKPYPSRLHACLAAIEAST